MQRNLVPKTLGSLLCSIILVVTGKMNKSDVKRLSQLADDYRDRASHNATENWSDLLKVR